MSVKNFKFVSPGVFINEIDNSFIPRAAEVIGPVIIGRSAKGKAMQPVTVESYSDFVTHFGDTVPGMGGGDIYRDGNYQSPMYATYAAKAFLNANVAPVTFVRLLGQQTTANTGGDAAAGWKTTNTISATVASNGGAYGLFVFNSSSNANIGTGSLAAIWYLDNGSILLSGTYWPGDGSDGSEHDGTGGGSVAANVTSSMSTMVASDSTGLFTVVISGSDAGSETIKFGFDDSKETFIRKRFNTNPQLVTAPGTFDPSDSALDYWLGETFEQELRDGGGGPGTSSAGVAGHGDLTATPNLVGIILGLAVSGASGPSST